ncbi:MAG: trypsin-like peptidase domain-containing protein [Zetaproteobacteria bacterium]|nr:trypsin-like peptidase domain-containing protein [Zetaproteobacteria bacterium]
MADDRIDNIPIEVEEFPEDCAIDMRRFFVLLAAAAVLILFGSYWYTEYYAKGVSIDRASFSRVNTPHASAQAAPQSMVAPVAMQAPAFNQPAVMDWNGQNGVNAMAVNQQGMQQVAGVSPMNAYQGGFAQTGPGSAQMVPEPMVPQQFIQPVANMNAPFDTMTPVTAMQVRTKFPNIVNKVSDTVVHIKVQTNIRQGGLNNSAMQQGGIGFAPSTNPNAVASAGGNVVGSGVIVSSDGYILTNFHVVRDASSLSVVVFTPQGPREYPAMIVKMSEKTDLALLKINSDVPLKVAVLANSDTIRVADEVIAIGSPFGLGQTVSQGIISAVRKTLIIEGVSHEDLLQTDAAINQGNSGGPLFDVNGKVVGINTAIYTPTGAFSGIGFAIPSNQARMFIGADANMKQANFLGATPTNMVAGMPLATTISPVAAMMQQVAMQGPPAAPVISPNASPPGSHNDGRNQMNCAACHQFTGQAAPVAMMGNGAMMQQVAAAPPPAPVISPNASPPGSHNDGRNQMNCAACHQFTGQAAPVAMVGNNASMGIGQGVSVVERAQILPGAEVRGINAQLAERLNHPVGKGVFVASVMQGSPADLEGLRAGDIILKVDGRRVRSPSSLLEQVQGLDNKSTVRLTILRDGRRERLGFVINNDWVAPVGANMAAPMVGGGNAMAAPSPRVPNEFNWKGIKIEAFNPPQPNAVNAAVGKVPGAVVDEVTPGSQASKAGVMPGDVMIELNGLSVVTPSTMNEAIIAASKGQDNLVKLVRAGREFFVIL